MKGKKVSNQKQELSNNLIQALIEIQTVEKLKDFEMAKRILVSRQYWVELKLRPERFPTPRPITGILANFPGLQKLLLDLLREIG
jgi:hypothetical protein